MDSDVYEGAPTSITSYFAVVPKVAGLALLIKFMFIPFSNILLEWQTIIIFISIASMILGAIAAMVQKILKDFWHTVQLATSVMLSLE